MDNGKQHTSFAWVGAVALGSAIVLALHTKGHLINLAWMPGLLWLIPALGFMAWWGRRPGVPAEEAGVDRSLTNGLALCLMLFVYLYSSATLYRWFYFTGWAPGSTAAELFLHSGSARFALFTALLTPLMCLSPSRRKWVLPTVLILGQLFCLYRFYTATDWLPLYRDDHPSFIARIARFAEAFPRLSCYDPSWNAGLHKAYEIASGTQSIGMLFLPFWRLGWVPALYTPLLGLLLVVVLPLVAAWAARIAGGRWPEAWAAAILAIGISPFYFMWSLHFGTTGAACSSPFLMLVCACMYRVLWLDRREPWVGVVLVLSAWHFLAWPVSAILSLALLTGLLMSWRTLSRAKTLYLVVCAAALALLLLPFVLTLLHSADIGGFAGIKKSGSPAWSASWAKGWGLLKSHARQAHPLLLFFGLGGVWFLRDRGLRCLYGSMFIVLLLLAGWGESWKPQFQLSRAAIPMLFLATLPAGRWVGRLVSSARVWQAPVRACLLALLVMGCLSTAKIYSGKERIQFNVMSREVFDMVDWIKSNVPREGRVLFAGPAVHAYGGGHVAPLPLFTDREMMACDYYHFSPKRVEYEYPPAAYRQSPDSVWGFMERFNVTHIFTHHKRWMAFLQAQPERYEKVWEFGKRTRKMVFRVKRQPSFFESGAGQVESELNRLRVQVDDPSGEVVLRYNWVEGLEVDPPVTIQPVEMGDGTTFIGAAPHGESAFTIRYGRWL